MCFSISSSAVWLFHQRFCSLTSAIHSRSTIAMPDAVTVFAWWHAVVTPSRKRVQVSYQRRFKGGNKGLIVRRNKKKFGCIKAALHAERINLPSTQLRRPKRGSKVDLFPPPANRNAACLSIFLLLNELLLLNVLALDNPRRAPWRPGTAGTRRSGPASWTRPR